MKNTSLTFVFVVALLSTLEATSTGNRNKRQNFIFPGGNAPQLDTRFAHRREFPDQEATFQRQRPATRAPATPVPTDAYINCLYACPSTNEYNPVCGSDNISYANQYRLSCAARCGTNVRLIRNGLCMPRG